MRLLLDTHCWLWFLLSPSKLSPAALALLESEESEILFSTASAWEIVIKHSIGKLGLPLPPDEYIPRRLADLGHQSLSIEMRHILRLHDLPDHHKDPFDRILIAQAMTEGARLMTADPLIRLYAGVPLFWAA